MGNFFAVPMTLESRYGTTHTETLKPEIVVKSWCVSAVMCTKKKISNKIHTTAKTHQGFTTVAVTPMPQRFTFKASLPRRRHAASTSPYLPLACLGGFVTVNKTSQAC